MNDYDIPADDPDAGDLLDHQSGRRGRLLLLRGRRYHRLSVRRLRPVRTLRPRNGRPVPATRRPLGARRVGGEDGRVEREAVRPRPLRRADALLYPLGLSHPAHRDDHPRHRHGHLDETARPALLLRRRLLPLVLAGDGRDGVAVRRRRRDGTLPPVRRPERATVGETHLERGRAVRLVAVPAGGGRLPHRGAAHRRHELPLLRDGQFRRLLPRGRLRRRGGVRGARRVALLVGLVVSRPARAGVHRVDSVRQAVPHDFLLCQRRHPRREGRAATPRRPFRRRAGRNRLHLRRRLLVEGDVRPGRLHEVRALFVGLSSQGVGTQSGPARRHPRLEDVPRGP